MNIWNEDEILEELVDAVEHERPQRLDLIEPGAGPAAYLFHYIATPSRHGDDRPHVALLEEFLGSGWPIYGGSCRSARERKGRHINTLATVRDLDAADFSVTVLPMPSLAAALYAEALLIGPKGYEPLLNQWWLSGIGSSNNQGATRARQKRSAFAALYGRTGCPKGPPRFSYTETITMMRDHLNSTVGEQRLMWRSK